jgi:hypothetical protein
MKFPLHFYQWAFNMFLKFPVCSHMLPIAPYFMPYLYPKFYSSNLYKQAWGGDYKISILGVFKKLLLSILVAHQRCPLQKKRKRKKKTLGVPMTN